LQVFEGVTTYPAILIFQNVKPAENSQIEMLILKDLLPDDLNETFKNQHGIMAHSQLKNESWQFEDARLSQLREKLTQGFPTLKDVYGSPYRGVLTGLNEAFVIDGETKKRLISQNPNSAELLKPFLEGKDLKKWHSQPRDLWLIFTRRGTDIEKYPAIKAHLEQYRSQLEPKPADFPENEKWGGRKEGKYKWFEIQDSISYFDEFEKKKIVYNRFMAEPNFFLDSKNFYFNNALNLIPKATYYELGILISSLSWYLLTANASTMSGGFYQIHGRVLEKLPIPPATPEQKTKIGELAQRCQTLSEARYKLENDTRLTISELGVKKLTQKLEKWWTLDFQELRDELKKSAKVEIELKKQTEWRNFFDDAKAEREKLDLQIRLLEKELNLLVYELFGLDDEEVLLIEN
jgi:hypothetical protein